MRIIEKVIDCRAQEFHRMTTDFSDIFFITLLCNACVTWGGPAVVRRHNPFFYPPDTDLFRPPAGDKTTIRWINHVRPVILTENLRSVLHLYKKMR